MAERVPLTVPVTVVIAAYERAPFIAAAVRSALAQVPAPVAVVVVDDGSSDGTADQAEAAGATVVRLAVNGGCAAARNVAIEAAATEWVALLDSDDTWRPGHLDRIWQARTGRVLVADSARGTSDHRLVGHPGPEPLLLDDPAKVVFPENPVLPSACLLHRPTVLAVGGFPSIPRAEDMALFAAMLQRGTGVVLADVGVDYEQHAGQVSADRPLMWQAHLEVVGRFADQPWCTAALRQSVDAVMGWDALRLAMQQRSVAETARLLPRVAGSAVRIRAIVALLQRRRRIRAHH